MVKAREPSMGREYDWMTEGESGRYRYDEPFPGANAEPVVDTRNPVKADADVEKGVARAWWNGLV